MNHEFMLPIVVVGIFVIVVAGLIIASMSKKPERVEEPKKEPAKEPVVESKKQEVDSPWVIKNQPAVSFELLQGLKDEVKKLGEKFASDAAQMKELIGAFRKELDEVQITVSGLEVVEQNRVHQLEKQIASLEGCIEETENDGKMEYTLDSVYYDELKALQSQLTFEEPTDPIYFIKDGQPQLIRRKTTLITELNERADELHNMAKKLVKGSCKK